MKPLAIFGASLFSLSLFGCRKPSQLKPDAPRLTPNVTLTDVTFHSAALNRDTTYRVIAPTNIPANTKLPVIFLLHGAGDTYRDWSNQSDIARLAEAGIVLVMPDAADSYYVNSAARSDQQYESYLVTDLIPDARRRFPIATDRAHNAVIGISRGGFGAVLLALKHPELFSFVGGLSSALDLAERPFRPREFFKSLAHRRTFGAPGSAARLSNDPYVLLDAAQPASLPYFYITCGDQDVLLATDKRFAAQLAARNLPSEFHIVPGGHNWLLWNAQLPAIEASVLAHLNPPQQAQP